MSRDEVTQEVTSSIPYPRSGAGRIRRLPVFVDSMGLLEAKLSPPHLPPGLVPRPRLHHLLRAGVRQRVTLVSAGPGWGKTVLAATWASAPETRCPVAWVSLDEDDNDPSSFWSYVVAALQRCGAVPAGNPLAELGAGPRHAEEHVRLVALGLSMLPRSVALVLDDFHLLHDRGVLEGVAAMLQYPSHLRLVLLTRSDPRLRLQRLRVAGQLTEIRVADLAFQKSEASALFEGAGLDLPDDQRQILLDRTEGWATGLRLAALSATQSDLIRRIEDFAGDVSAVSEYLTEEVLAAQPPVLRSFLLRTSVVERLCADLANELTDRLDGQRVIEQLEQDNAFVVALGPRRQWFRYHPLLGDLLRHQLALEQPELVPELHRRAAQWFASHGLALEAVRHASHARDWPLLARLVICRATPRLVSVEAAALATLLAEIPPDELSASGDLATCAALSRFAAHDYIALPHFIARARELLDSGDRASRPTEVVLRVLDLAAARIAGDVAAVVGAASDVLAWLPDVPLDVMPAGPQMRLIALGNRGVGLLWLGQLDEAEKALRTTRLEARAATLELAELNVLGHLALLKAIQGCLWEARTVAGEALDLAERRGWTMLGQNVATYLALALTHLQWADVREAQRMVGMGMAAQQVDGERIPLVALRVMQTQLLVTDGRVAAARAASAAAHRTAGATSWPSLANRWLVLADAEIELAAGEPAAALDVLEPLLRDASFAPARLLAARAYVALDDAERAQRLLASARSDTTEHLDAVGVGEAVQALLLDALVADRLWAEEAALGALTRALEVAEPENIRRPFVVLDDPRLPALLRRCQTLAPHISAFAEQLIGLLTSRTGRVSAAVPPVEPLSARELRVLRALPTMASNAEIAGDLFISTNTVKAHTKAIYRKLQVANRREAVLRARDLGLI